MTCNCNHLTNFAILVVSTVSMSLWGVSSWTNSQDDLPAWADQWRAKEASFLVVIDAKRERESPQRILGQVGANLIIEY